MTAAGSQEGSEISVAAHDGETVPLRVLYHDRTSDRETVLAVSDDGMRAYMKVIPGGNFSGLTRDGVVAIIAAAGVVHGLIEPGILLFVGTQNGSSPFKGFFQVAAGVPMRRGENGSVEFHVQPTSMDARYDENDAGAIDYKQLNLIENCFAGQRVASILPPGPGRPGRNVFDDEIPPMPGEPVKVQAGPGIILSSNGRDFTSEIEGRLVFEDNILSVSPVLEISRDIDYSVGNVDFVGKVTVHGSLLDGFYINAKRGVELNGDMGAGHITSEGDVVIKGGIKGKNAAIITCRSLTARYIDDASVEASGDVTAAKEIMNSSVKALGRVSVAGGAIIGGEVCGFQGVEADTLGSDMGVATWVMAGLNWTEENRKDEIRTKVAEYMDRAQSAKVLLDPLFSDREVTMRLGSEQKSMLSDLVSELRDLRELLVELLDERASIDGREQVGRVDQINVRKMLYQGVATRFSHVDAQVKDSIKGPVSLTPDEGHNALHIGAHKSLPSVQRPTKASEAAADPAGNPEENASDDGADAATEESGGGNGASPEQE